VSRTFVLLTLFFLLLSVQLYKIQKFL
jgi:hypothetical protein